MFENDFESENCYSIERQCSQTHFNYFSMNQKRTNKKNEKSIFSHQRNEFLRLILQVRQVSIDFSSMNLRHCPGTFHHPRIT